MPTRDQIEKARSWLLGIIADGEHAGVMRMAESLLAATEPVPPEDPRDKRIAELEAERDAAIARAEKAERESERLRSDFCGSSAASKQHYKDKLYLQTQLDQTQETCEHYNNRRRLMAQQRDEARAEVERLTNEREKVRSEVQKLRSLLGEDTCLNELQRICGLMEAAP